MEKFIPFFFHADLVFRNELSKFNFNYLYNQVMKEAQKVLKEVFGYDQFRADQAQIIQHILEKKDALVLMPTGGGKSICFQIPALLFDGVALVISPLISLMKDQVESLLTNGVPAAYLNSSQSETEKQDVLNRAQQNELKLLYISPETLMSGMQTWMRELKLSMVAIDEAHCVSMWGHDFRPEYTMIRELRNQFSEIPFVALTATADKLTKKDIQTHLGLSNPTLFSASFDRPNLSLEVMGNIPKKEKVKQIVDFIQARPNDPGIIYCLSRKETEEWSTILQNNGIQVAFYHAGLPADERAQVQEDFVNDEIPVICATIAFGMGIDKSNVRWVIHTNLPKNMEGYYQEIGRAGRDGMPSITRLYYNYRDVILLKDFASQSDQQEVLIEKLNRMLQYAEASTCRRRILLAYFGESMAENCGNCDVCKNPPAYIDGTILAQKALSAIKRTNEQVTSNLLIDVLRGAKTASIYSLNYHQLKTYGIGGDLSWQAWSHHITEMKNLGLFDVAYDENMHLKITEYGTKVLFENEKIQLTQYNPIKNSPEPKTRQKMEPVPLTSQEVLFNKLKMLRKKLAVEKNVPPYLIFNDSTLHEMTLELPKNTDDLLAISGIGMQKAASYGVPFLELIQTHVEENRPKLTTYEETLILMKAGKSLEEIASERNLHPTTIYSHIAKLFAEGYPIDIDQFLTTEEIQKIAAVCETIEDTSTLKPIFEALNGEIDYGKIRLTLAILDKEPIE